MGSGGPKTSLAIEAKHAITCAYALARYGRPGTFVHYGSSPGDSLLCTAVLHELRSRSREKLWLMANQRELFAGNPDIDAVRPCTPRWLRAAAALGGREVEAEYAPFIPGEDRSIPPAEHIIAAMCRVAGVTGRIALRPYVHLRAEEKAAGRRVERQVCVQSSVLNARMPIRNKEWYPQRMQQVVDALRDQFNFVQLGAAGDPALSGTLDLRGKTTLREAAAILSQSIGLVGLIGFLMHLARAVDRRAVIVFGGREAPTQSGYTANINLYTPVPCSPCWLWNTCPHDRTCLNQITAEHVIAAVRQMADQPEPMEAQVVEL